LRVLFGDVLAMEIVEMETVDNETDFIDEVVHDKEKLEFSIKDLIHDVPEDIDRSIKYTFYYDESNNAGKLWVKPNEEGSSTFNADIDENFVLAGIVTDKINLGIDLCALYKRLGIKNQAPELKFKKHFSEKNILETVKRPRTLNFLKLIDELNIDIHVTNVNSFYFGIVDIIDEFINLEKLLKESGNNDCFFMRVYCGIKQLFYDILHGCTKETEKLFNTYNYPNIEKCNQDRFCDDLVALLKKYSGSMSKHPFFRILLTIIEEGKNVQLVLLKGNPSHTLLENYTLWYLQRALLFPHSTHVFDKNRQISSEIQRIVVKDKDKIVNNYSFDDSRNVIGIQLSDVICGLYGQFYTYINKKSDFELAKDINKLNQTQLACFDLLFKLQVRSDKHNRGYFYATVPQNFMERAYKFLQRCSILAIIMLMIDIA